MIKKAAYIFCSLLLTLVTSCSKADMFMLEGEGTIIISGIISDKDSGKALKDIQVIYEAYSLRGKLIDTKTVYSSSDGTYTIESNGYTTEINCSLKASDSKNIYSAGEVEINVDWEGSPFNIEDGSFVVNNCNFYLKKL